MKPIMSLERQDAILAMENKRTQIICALMEGNHVDGLDEILRLVDRPVVTPEELVHEPEDRTVAQINKWYDLIANACRWVQNIGLTMTDHVPVYWFDETVGDIQWTYADELVFCLDEQDVEYKGQQLLAVEVKDIIPKILRPLMDEAIEAGDAQCIDRLAQTMVYVLTELKSQEAGDVD